MPDGSLPSPASTVSRTQSTSSLSWIAGWALPATFALLFLAVEFQPSISHGHASVRIVDLALAVLVLAALAVLREDVHRLDGSRWLWATAVAFCVFVTAASLYPLVHDGEYAWRTHLITAGRFAVYALLAPAIALLARDARSLHRLWATVAVLSLVAAAVAVVQFLGVDIFDAWPPGNRQPSFTGIPDLGALGGAALAVGFLGLLWPGAVARWVTAGALAGGAIDVVLERRRGADRRRPGRGRRDRRRRAPTRPRLAADRHGRGRGGRLRPRRARAPGLRLLAVRASPRPRRRGATDATADVQTYAHRQLIYYIGLRVFLGHPCSARAGSRFREEQVYSPYLADAHRRFPDEPPQAFPAPDQRQYGIDNAYIQVARRARDRSGSRSSSPCSAPASCWARAGRCARRRHAWQALVGLLWLLVDDGHLGRAGPRRRQARSRRSRGSRSASSPPAGSPADA